MHVLYYRLPSVHAPEKLSALLLESRTQVPVLSQAADSLARMDAGAPIFATMVFGHMAKYIGKFAERVRRIKLPNVVVFALDAAAQEACVATQSLAGPRLFCMRGKGRTALQKYVVVLSYLVLGWDVFWFDFDSVWLQNPVPHVKAALEKEPSTEILAAIDFDSTNCAMNGFFWVKAVESARTWLLSLMHWIYKRPYAHDQVAFTTLLGIGPLVDDDPLPTPPAWRPLDPNVFANAARFSGLGFSSEVEELVLFHFFDGWNSGQPGSEVEDHATPIYRGQNIFEALYGDDAAAARAAIAKSRLPPPRELRDCRYMTDLGLGVHVTPAEHISIPV